jgi:hypothetical protein
MQKINNIHSIFFCNNNDYSILTYIDINDKLSNNFILNYMNEIIINNPILKKKVIKIHNDYYFKDIKMFNMKKYYKIKYIKSKNFNKFNNIILNYKFEKKLKWIFYWLIDKKLNNIRLYFKIHHLYVDGYKLINILTNPLIKYKLPSFKRKQNNNIFNTIYYYFIGTIILIIYNINILINLFFYKKNIKENIIKNNISDHIICKSFDFNKIKKYTTDNNITINDFLYALMIKTDKIYTNIEKELIICSPIYIPSKSNIINAKLLLHKINNSINNNDLLKLINTRFNNYKFSLFIFILDYISNYYISKKIIDNITEKVDYNFTNIIGPSLENLKINIKNIHFLVKPKNKQIIYNIISCNNNINIICTFQKGIIADKKKFKKCIYKAYNNLLNECL